MLLEKGANHITTLEYAPIENHHPNITVLLPDQLRKMYINGTFKENNNMFDAVVTFSTLEHSGLGRYAYFTVYPFAIEHQRDIIL